MMKLYDKELIQLRKTDAQFIVAFSYLHFVPLGFHGEAFKECSINAVTP
jgi:hypothetical protein